MSAFARARWACAGLAAWSLAAGSPALAVTIYRVGPARPYASLQEVSPLLAPGDTVLVDGDHTYPGGVVFHNSGDPANRIVIRGVRVNDRRPIISGGSDGVKFQTDSPYSDPGADHYTFEGFEITGATNRGIFHQADDLIPRDVVVHHCLHGILGADQGAGSCLIEFSELYANGSGDSRHQIYMASDEVNRPGSVFRLQFCFVHDGAGGNNVKSRAERNEIYYNWIEGGYYHELELIGAEAVADGGNPDLKREDSDVVGNVLWKKTKPVGNTQYFYVTRIGGDGTGESAGRYRFVNNTFLCGASAAFRIFHRIESVEMHNNVFHRIDGTGVQITRTVEAEWTTGSAVIAGQNNWVQTGSTQVPAQWTGTLTGPDPEFIDLADGYLYPSPDSPLRDAGTMLPSGPPGFPFPVPLFPPLHTPPAEPLLGVATSGTRHDDDAIDIGAFELNRVDDVPGGRDPDGTPFARLHANAPNPFGAKTLVRFSLARAMPVTVTVHDLAGRRVAMIVERVIGAGDHALPWEPRGLASGVYFCRLRTPARTAVRRMLITR